MSVKKVLMFLLLGMLITNYTLSQTTAVKPKTNPKIQKLLKELTDSQEGPGRVETLVELARVYRRSDPQKALNYAKQGLTLSRKIDFKIGIAKSLNEMGTYHFYQGNYPRALEYYFKNLRINEELGDRKGLSNTYIYIGYIYTLQHDYSNALEYSFKSLKINEELGDRKGVSNVYNNIGLNYSNQDNYPGALEYYLKSLKIKEELGDRKGLSYAYNNIGIIHFKQGNYPKALEYHFKSVKIKEELGNRKGLCSSYDNIGNTYRKLGELKKSLDYLHKALKIAEKIDAANLTIIIFGDLSDTYSALKNFEKAFEYHKRYSTLRESIFNTEKHKEMSKIQTLYEVEKKDKENRILKQNNQIQQLALGKRKNLISAFIFSSALMVLLLFFIYSRFHLKKKSNLVIRAEKEKAVKANKAKSEFIANMSHELRTPLNAVIGFSELLFSMAGDQKQKNYTQSIRTAGKSLLTLINDILDLSKIESGMMEIKYAPVNPILIFNEIEQIFHEQIVRKNLAYITDIDENLPDRLLLDETRLRQILLNLVGNAVKFTEHGHIKLSAKKGNETDQPGLSARTPGTSTRTPGRMNLIISVEDTGIGIPPEEQELIFQPFKQQSGQSTRKYGGTGLGLSICKRLTGMMNGRISVESRPGEGSCFKLVLENVNVPSAEVVIAPDESFNLDDISFETARVLVVDDVESNRNVLREMLTRVNLDVLTAENGPGGLRIAGECLPDVIITDIVMPGMDGFEMAEALKSNPKTKDIPIIVLSASSTVEQKEKIMESGFFAAFLEKPVNVNNLFKELSNHIPYSRTTGADDPNRFGKLPEETLRRLPKLIKTLREDILPLTENFKGALKTEEVKKFADKVNRLGEEFAVPGLIDYADRLNEFEQDFDIEGIKKSLADFPMLVKDLVLHLEAYDASEC